MRVRDTFCSSGPANGVAQGAAISFLCLSCKSSCKWQNQLFRIVLHPFSLFRTSRCFSEPATSTNVQVVIQPCVNKMSKWTPNNGFNFSISKRRCVLFSKKRKLQRPESLKSYGQPIIVDVTIKYLGLILHKKLGWKPHIEAENRNAYTMATFFERFNLEGWTDTHF